MALKQKRSFFLLIDKSTKRWLLIKSEFIRHCSNPFRRQRSAARHHKGEQAVWQRLFWEHQLCDEADFVSHMEYIHYNPVSHGLVKAPRDWAYSSFHRAVRWGLYTEDWGAEGKVVELEGVGRE